MSPRLFRRLGRSLYSLRRAARFARHQGLIAAVRRIRADRLPLSPVPDLAYRDWLREQRAGVTRVSPTAVDRISLLVPLHASKREHLCELYESVRAQSYPNWELCFSVDGELAPELRTLLTELRRSDDRVVVHDGLSAPGISAATNAALRVSRGSLVGLLDHDDLLAPLALETVARSFRDDAELDLVYTDEDMLSPRGERRSPLLKPGFSPMLLLGTNYVMHLVVMRREHIEKIGGLRSSFDGAQDHDLLLRSFESARRTRHLGLIGYHWREASTSVASGSGAKPWAYERGRAAVEEACMRRGLPVTRVTHSAIPGLFELELEPPSSPLPVHAVLYGARAACERWSAMLQRGPEALRPRSISIAHWPEKLQQNDSVLVVDARVVPNERAIDELHRWAAVPCVGAVGSSGRGRWLPAPTGLSVSRAGRAHTLPALTIHARLPHEVAVPGTEMLLLVRPDLDVAQTLCGLPFARVDAACMALRSWVEDRFSLFVPIPHLRPKIEEPLDVAELDLSSSPLWEAIAESLPHEFWSGGSDRFAQRHPLLTPLGQPPGLR